MGAALRDLIAATRCCDLRSPSSISALIGLGVGLTPSGDDLLVGYLAGLWCTHRDQRERIQYLFSLGKAVVRLYRQTNDISRTYLYHAVRGQFSSRLTALAEAISHGQPSAQIVTVLNSAMQVGHTSGMDAVTGLLVGLATWDDTETLLHELRAESRETH
jgi:hypothetical protein